MKKRGLVILPSIILLGWWLLQPVERQKSLQEKNAQTSKQENILKNKSSVGTQASITEQKNQFVLYFGLKAFYDQFIFNHENLPIEQLISTYNESFANTNLTMASRRYAEDLFSRYVNYKAELEELDDQVRANSLQYVRQRLQARDDLRHQRFSEREYYYLFSHDAAYDDAALERLRIASDRSLDRVEKQRLIEQQLSMLPEDQQASFAPSIAINRLSQIQQRYVNTETRYQAVAAEYGHDVASRLAKLNQHQVNWVTKVRNFKKWQENLHADTSLSESEVSILIQEKRNQMFDDKEQRRLLVYLENPTLLDNN